MSESFKVSAAVRWLAGAHCAYFALTGIWPILHMPSFLAVTGPKHDLWLVQFFGALVCVPALAVGHAAATGRVSGATWLVAIASTAILAGGDVLCVARGAIGPVYLIDAGIELVLLGGWCVALIQHGRSNRTAG